MVSDPNREYVLQKVREHNVRFVRLWFTDLFGVLKGTAINVEELEEALDGGVGFDGAAIEGLTSSAETRLVAFPDRATFQILPWRPKEDGAVARMFCDILYPDGTPYEGGGRHILKNVLRRAANSRYTFYVGPEIEFFYFRDSKQPVPVDSATFFDQMDQGVSADLRRKTALILEQMGVSVKASHHEHAPGQHEIDLCYTDALSMADNAVTTRCVIKEVAQSQGVFASFMPKPLQGMEGCGMHVNQSLFRGDRNAFYSSRASDGLSQVARHYMAGLLRHAGEITFVCNQWVNSYKRLASGYQAPCRIGWAYGDRSAFLRVPPIRKERPDSVRVELRSPDPACNIYLAFATMLAAGLTGIEKRYPLPRPLNPRPAEEGPPTPHLPETLRESMNCANESEFLRETLGDHVVDRLVACKQKEWCEYHKQVTPFEIDRYLGML